MDHVRFFWGCNASPDEDSACLFDRYILGLHVFGFYILGIRIVQIDSQLQSPIGHVAPALEQVDPPGQHVINVIATYPST